MYKWSHNALATTTTTTKSFYSLARFGALSDLNRFHSHSSSNSVIGVGELWVVWQNVCCVAQFRVNSKATNDNLKDNETGFCKFFLFALRNEWFEISTAQMQYVIKGILSWSCAPSGIVNVCRTYFTKTSITLWW